MKAELISVGTEILMGQIVNTNAQYISQRLAEMGIDVFIQTTIGDNHARLGECLKESLARADIVITTGGLGPTCDDLTKETAADIMGKTLAYDEASLHVLKARFEAMHREMTPNNLKQAMFPKDSRILPNPNGTAPGCIMERDNKAIILLPGPPREMKPMFEASVMPYLQERSGYILYSRILHIFGMGESHVEYALRELMEAQSNPTIAPYAKTGEVTLRLTARCRDEQEGEAMVAPVMEQIKEIVGDVIYSTRDESLPCVCVQKLIEQKKTLSLAESCTGGMLASSIVDVPGCSACFMQAAVTYSNHAKQERLGVSPETLEKYGAVSEQTAKEMAEGMRRTSGTDYALALTGVAGPEASEGKPAGLVFIALASEKATRVKKAELSGDRERIRTIAALHALDMLRRELEEN